MAKSKTPKIESVEPVVEKLPGDARVVIALRIAAAVVAALSVVALLKPDLRLWAVHGLAYLPLPLSLGIIAAAVVLCLPIGATLIAKIPALKLKPMHWAAGAFALFMLLSAYGSLMGDGQLAIARLAIVGDMLESKQSVPPGRFFSQKEPGTMMLHEAAFRLGVAMFGPEMNVAQGRAGQQARVERQLIYRGFAQQTIRLLACLSGALFVLFLVRFVRSRTNLNGNLFWAVMLTGSGWLTFFGYVENYAYVSVLMMLFLMAGLKAMQPPRKVPIVPILLFAVACALHFMAIVLLPALVFLLWTMHFEPRDVADENTQAPRKRALLLAGVFAVLGGAAFIYLKAWDGWSGFIPVLPRWVKDGYALFSVKHGADLLNLALFACASALVILFLLKPVRRTVRESNQEFFLLFASASGALFACVFSPNLGMPRDWDIVTTALWPLLFYGAWRLSQYEFTENQSRSLRASLAALSVLILVPALLVQAIPSSAIERYSALLELDRSRSAYGWENLAMYYQREGDSENRIAAWKRAVEIDPNPRYYHNLGEALKLAGRIDEADSAAVESVRRNKDLADNLFYLAIAQGKRGNLSRARELVHIAVDADPAVKYGPQMVKWADRACEVDSFAQMGNLARARELLQQYAQLDSTNSFWPEFAQKLGK